jgi:hypothetical protein
MINIHHWAHRAGDCDPWYEPESAWHLGWKSRAPADWCEVFMGPHRADIRRPHDGLVIELQHSSLAPEDVLAREAFYSPMIWIVDGSQYRKAFGRPEPLLPKQPYKPPPFLFEEEADGRSAAVFWRPRFPKRWAVAAQELYFDFGAKIFKYEGTDERWVTGRLLTRDEFSQQLGLAPIRTEERERFGVWLRMAPRIPDRPRPTCIAFEAREHVAEWCKGRRWFDTAELVFADGSVESVT